MLENNSTFHGACQREVEKSALSVFESHVRLSIFTAVRNLQGDQMVTDSGFNMYDGYLYQLTKVQMAFVEC